jgi:uncharacterized protein YodC (DUF2158 family)
MRQLFQPGDPIRVKGTDGPEMMVEGYDAGGQVVCSFWEGVSRKQVSFPEASLERIPPHEEKQRPQASGPS